MPSKPNKKSAKPAKKAAKRRPATVGLNKIKMFKVPGAAWPVGYRVDKLGRKTRVEIVRGESPDGTPISPFKRMPDSFYKFKVVRSSSKKR